MKKKNIKNGLVLFLFSFLMLPTITNAQELAGEITENTTLTEDVILTDNVTIKEGFKLVVAKNANITLNLNGYSITKMGSNYAIDNGTTSTLKIVDNGATKGKITCDHISSSCIRNYNEMEIDGVTISAVFTAVKTEEKTTLTIKNSDITSSSFNCDSNGKCSGAGTIMNYGDTNITNSKISHSTKGGVAIFALTYKDFASSIVIKDSEIKATQAVQTYYDDGAEKPTTAKANVVIDGGTIAAGSAFNLRPIEGVEAPSKLGIKGNVTAPITALQYAQEGTKITLNENVSEGEYTIPKNVTLNIPEKYTFTADKLTNNGTITTDNNQEIIVNEDGSVELTYKSADYSKVEEAMKAATALDKSAYTNFNIVEEAIYAVKYDKKINEQDVVDQYAKAIMDAIAKLEKVKVEAPIPENPQTGDNISAYIIASILSGCGLAYVIKKQKFCINM